MSEFLSDREAEIFYAEQRGYASAMEAERKLHEARIEEMEAKLTGAVAECERIGRLWHDAEAKLAKAMEALEHAKLNMPHPDQMIDGTLAELKGGKDD